MNKIISLTLLSLFSNTDYLFCMQAKGIEITKEFVDSLKGESQLQVAIISENIKSILDKSNDIEEAISLIAEDFKQIHYNDKALYSKILRFLARIKFAKELVHVNRDELKLDLDFTKPQAREKFIKTFLVKDEPNFKVALLNKSEDTYSYSFEPAFIYFVQQGEELLVKLLIICGADLNIKNEKGFTGLQIALAQNNQSMAHLLNKYGAKFTE